MKINLHNHTHYSDGAFSPEELIKFAIESGFTHIGITDHYTAKIPGSNSVMSYGLEKYIEDLRALSAKYSPYISVLLGLEIIFSILQTDFSSFNLPFPDRNLLNKLDFVLFEYVQDSSFMGLSLEELVKIRPFLNMPIGLAHADFSRNFSDIPPKELANTLAKNKIFVELCPSTRNSRVLAVGYAKYMNFFSFLKPPVQYVDAGTYVPYYRVENSYNKALYKAFKNSGVLFSIGTDTHEFKEEFLSVYDSEFFLAEKNITERLICYHYWLKN